MFRLVIWLIGCSAPAFSFAAEPLPPSVLILDQSDTDSAWYAAFSSAFRSALQAGSAARTSVYAEHLDLSRFGGQRHEELLRAYLREKYRERPIGVLIAQGSSALEFVLRSRAELWPGLPVVFASVDEATLNRLNPGPGVTGTIYQLSFRDAVNAAKTLVPDLKRIALVGDSWERQAVRRHFKDEIPMFAPAIEFIDLMGLPMTEIRKRVAVLPEKTAIIHTSITLDGAGVAYIPHEALKAVAAVANRPIVIDVETSVGYGATGGFVSTPVPVGAAAARLALRVLAGEKPSDIPITKGDSAKPVFDWRELKRWGINAAALPPGSEVRFRELSLWDLYRWHIIGVISLCIVETLLIVGLLLERSSRRQAEARLRKSQQELRALSGRLLAAQETEDRRIARELHDDLNQGLALLSVEMELLGQNPPASAGQLGRRMQELSARVRQLSSTVHGLSHRLHPHKLEQLGLVAAVAGLCRELTQAHGLKIEFTHQQMPDTFPPDTAVCLYRLVQEALRNAIKHSGAQHIEVDLRGSADAVSLKIVDEGVGFDPSLLQGKEGLGLVSMRERVHHFDGEITIDSQPSSGTQISVRLPLGATDQTERL